MTTRTLDASNTKHVPASTRTGDSVLLTDLELDAVAAGGGGAGVNPSRNDRRA